MFLFCVWKRHVLIISFTEVYEEWNLRGTGPLATNGIEAGVKIRPTAEELKDFERWPTPHFKDGWKSYFEKKPDKPVMHYSVISGWFGDHMLMPAGKFFTMFHFLEYPFSRGSTHIKSPDPYESPDFDTGFMNDERDMVPMVWGYIKSRETARRMDAYAGEVEAMVSNSNESEFPITLSSNTNRVNSTHSTTTTRPPAPTTWTS